MRNQMPIKQRASKAQGMNHLEILPPAVVALILQQCSGDARKALLRVSRFTRDAVLHAARSVQLDLRDGDAAEARMPLVRFLHRICSADNGRLSLVLDATKVRHQQTHCKLLANLLHYGILQRGWHSVKELTIKVGFCFCCGLMVSTCAHDLCHPDN
jgi:hypothetical protein